MFLTTFKQLIILSFFFFSKIALAALVERWLKFPYLYENVQGFYSVDNTIEIMHTRKSLGVIILKEKNESLLFFRLMQTLISGNSIIVIFGPNYYDLSPYCEMFLTSGIPPGVVNLLLREETEVIEEKLCLDEYTCYANKYFLKGVTKEAYVTPYKNLTIAKQVIIHLK